MRVDVRIIDGPLPAPAPQCPLEGAGAVLCFRGLVRPLEDGRPIAALNYEVYEPMARQVLSQIAEELILHYALGGVCVEHSRGRVGVGQCSFRLQLASQHRQEALLAVGEFIDRMKLDVPIWKNPIWLDAEST